MLNSFPLSLHITRLAWPEEDRGDGSAAIGTGTQRTRFCPLQKNKEGGRENGIEVGDEERVSAQSRIATRERTVCFAFNTVVATEDCCGLFPFSLSC